MKKKLLLLTALLLAAVLSGCECKHEFTEADCLNPQVCTKCETQGDPALGHDFAPATCDAPETCTRCGETQGEKLEHTYGGWQFDGEEMFKTCEGCGGEERTAIDRELYLREELLGFWGFDTLYEDDEYYHSYNLNYNAIGDYLDLMADGSAYYYDMMADNVVRCTWEYSGFDNSSGSDIYTIALDSEETGSFGVYFEDHEGTDADIAFYLYGGSNAIFMSRHEPYASTLAGSWVCIEDDGTYTLNLNPDHSFTLDLDPEISGTWHITAPYASGTSAENASAYMTLKLHYPSDDKFNVYNATIYLGSTNQSTEEFLNFLDANGYFSFFVKDLDISLSFEKMTPEELEAYYQALENSTSVIAGEWTSKVIEAMNYETSEGSSKVNTNYSVTFGEDGSFAAMLDKELTGSWTLRDMNVYDDSVSYYYDINIDGQDSNWYVNIYPNSSDVELHYYVDGLDYTITLGRLSEEDKAKLAEGPTLIVGDWNCTSKSHYDYVKQESVDEEATGSMRFLEDGTFTLTLDQEYTGTWIFTNYSSDNGYEYSVRFDNSQDSGRYVWNMFESDAITIFMEQDGTYYSYHMFKN